MTVPQPATRPAPDAVELDIADAIGRLMHFWGFKRALGRVWTLLYLSPSPLSAAELAERLKMSAGAMSMTLTELIRWGAVLKTWQPGQRRDFYEAETRVYRLVLRVLRDRELQLVRDALDVLRRSKSLLPTRPAADSATAFKRSRVDRLCRLAEVGELLLVHLVAGESVDPSVIGEAASGPFAEAEQ